MRILFIFSIFILHLVLLSPVKSPKTYTTRKYQQNETKGISNIQKEKQPSRQTYLIMNLLVKDSSSSHSLDSGALPVSSGGHWHCFPLPVVEVVEDQVEEEVERLSAPVLVTALYPGLAEGVKFQSAHIFFGTQGMKKYVFQKSSQISTRICSKDQKFFADSKNIHINGTHFIN